MAGGGRRKDRRSVQESERRIDRLIRVAEGQSRQTEALAAQLAEVSIAEPWRGCSTTCKAPSRDSSRARRYWRRPLALRQAKPAGRRSGCGSTSTQPWARSRNGRATTSAVISAAAGLPGKPSQGVPCTLPKASGLPGWMASRHRCSSPSSVTACLR